MSTEKKTCPNCDASLKNSLLTPNNLVGDAIKDLINVYQEYPKDGYCDRCYKNYLSQAMKFSGDEIERIRQENIDFLAQMPVVSSHSPRDWDYQTIHAVTGQSVMGTGLLTEALSGFSDLFGRDSEAINKKIREGERRCYLQLKKQAAELGGNAVVALDIDYNELGGTKGMIMVCMTGTAVIVPALSSSSEYYQSNTKRLQLLYQLRYTAAGTSEPN